jgi:hypothetical protein
MRCVLYAVGSEHTRNAEQNGSSESYIFVSGNLIHSFICASTVSDREQCSGHLSMNCVCVCVCCHRVPSELPAISLFDLQGTVIETYVSCLAISCLIFYRHSYELSAHVCKPRLSLREYEDTERWLPYENRLQVYLTWFLMRQACCYSNTPLYRTVLNDSDSSILQWTLTSVLDIFRPLDIIFVL